MKRLLLLALAAALRTTAAASGMSFGCSAPMHPDRFVVDRPFVFFIRDPDGRFLFAGALFDPTP